MNSLENVRDNMSVVVSENKVRLTIEIDFYPHNGFLKVGNEPMNRWQGPGRIAAWSSAMRFVMQQIEVLEQDHDQPQQRVVA